MYWTAAQAQKHLETNKEIPLFLVVYGEDQGAVKMLAKAFSDRVVDNTEDPFSCDKISAEAIVSENSLIRESAETLGFGAEKKLVLVQGFSSGSDKSIQSSILSAVKDYLTEMSQHSVVVISAPGLEKTSAIVKHVEKHPQAVAIRCFQENSRDIKSILTTLAKRNNIQITPEAEAFLLDSLGHDKELTQQELEKLFLYTQGKSELTLEDCLNSVANAPSVNIFKLCDAIADRNTAKAVGYLQQMQEEGEDLNASLAMVMRHLRRLLHCRELFDSGMPLPQAMSKLSPPVRFGQDTFSSQVRHYPLKRLQKAVTRFYEVQKESRTGILSSNEVIERALLGLSF